MATDSIGQDIANRKISCGINKLEMLYVTNRLALRPTIRGRFHRAFIDRGDPVLLDVFVSE